MAKRRPVSERFWEKVSRDDPDDCWEWTASGVPAGYGHLMVHDGERGWHHEYAHRISWRLHFGEIPDGLFVCHQCDNPRCVNPTHLFLGTAADNVRDRDAKGRAFFQKGRSNFPVPKSKIPEETIQAIQRCYVPGVYGKRRIAKDFGLHPSTIYRILRSFREGATR